MASTSKTQPPHVPPLASCRTAHNFVAAGRRGSGARSSRGGRAASSRVPAHTSIHHQIHRAFQFPAVDHDLDLVAFAHFADAGRRPALPASRGRCRRRWKRR